MKRTQAVNVKFDRFAGKWNLVLNGRTLKTLSIQTKAITSAKRLAKQKGTKLAIYGKNGKIRLKSNYGI